MLLLRSRAFDCGLQRVNEDLVMLLKEQLLTVSVGIGVFQKLARRLRLRLLLDFLRALLHQPQIDVV